MMDSIIKGLFSTEGGTVWLVVKWALIVLAAGFIGQFGKAFASYLIRRTRKDRTVAPQGLPGTGPKESMQGTLRGNSSQGQAEQMPVPERPATEPAGRLEAGKKGLKEQAKQQKKAMKNLKKMFK
jgi:hypothetical protein